jgi:hypothetical protein
MGDDTRTEGIDIDLSNATQEQLKKITETSDEDLQAQFDNKEPIIGGEKTPVVEKEGEEPPAPAPKAVKKTKQDGIVVDMGDGRPAYNFKDMDELKQSFVNAQKLVADVTGKFGNAKQQLARMKDLEDKFGQAQRQIEELRQGKAQVAAGQQPTAISEKTVQAAANLGFDVSTLTAENFAEKSAEWAAAIKAETAKELDERSAKLFEEKYAPQLKKIEDLEKKFGEISGNLADKEAKVSFEMNLGRVFSEVKKLQEDKSTGGLLKTQWPLEKINEVLLTHTPEEAMVVLPPGDFEKAKLIFGETKATGEQEPGLLHIFCGKAGDGSLDITSRTIPDINAAFAAFSVMRKLSRPDIAAAHKQGQENVLDALKKVTNKPPTLPNNLSSSATLDGMTLERAQALMDLNPNTIPKDSELYKEWQKAQEFILNYKE